MSGVVTARIGEFCETGSGGTPSRENWVRYYDSGTIPWVKSGELREGIVTHTEEHITEAALQETSAKLVPSGAVLLAMYGATVGRLAILGVQAATNQAVCHIVPDPKKADARYLFHGLRAQVPKLILRGVGGAQPNISQTIVKELSVPLPALEEQRRIAEVLDRAEGLRAKRRSALAKLDALTQSIFLDLFGDPVENQKNWPKAKMGDILRIRRGGSPRPIEQFLGGTINWIKIGDATGGDDVYLYRCAEKITEAGLKKTVFLRSGTLIFANCGVSLGFARILKIDGCIHDGWLSLEDIPETKLDKFFLLKALNAITLRFRAMAPEGTQPNLNTQLMKNFEVILPPIDLQRTFSRQFERLSDLKMRQQRSLSQLDALFAALQQRAFRGEL